MLIMLFYTIYDTRCICVHELTFVSDVWLRSVNDDDDDVLG